MISNYRPGVISNTRPKVISNDDVTIANIQQANHGRRPNQAQTIAEDNQSYLVIQQQNPQDASAFIYHKKAASDVLGYFPDKKYIPNVSQGGYQGTKNKETPVHDQTRTYFPVRQHETSKYWYDPPTNTRNPSAIYGSDNVPVYTLNKKAAIASYDSPARREPGMVTNIRQWSGPRDTARHQYREEDNNELTKTRDKNKYIGEPVIISTTNIIVGDTGK